MQDKLQGTENSPAITERRACPRSRVNSLMYIDIGNINGGIVTSLSENGLALTAAATLRSADFGEGPLQMRIQFPGVPEAFEANGEIVWTSASGKEGCVRFAEVEDKAREQIRRWISDQASPNGVRPEPPGLPKMQLPTSRRTNPRGPRFSFADVASSRVDSEGETADENSSETARELGALPPLQGQSGTFVKVTEAVASAFESTAFTEHRTGEIRSYANEQTTPTTSGQNLQRQPPLSIQERRQHARRPILLFTYAVLGGDNGGLVFNLGEGGLALTAAAPLQEDQFNKMRVRFPDSEDWIETSGRLAWKSDSGKEVGIEFVGLPEDARLRIGEWVCQEEPTGNPHSEGEAGTGQSPVQGLPSFMDPDEFSAETIETPASFEEQPFENQAFQETYFEERAKASALSSLALFKTGIKGILERASVRRRVAKIKPPRIAGGSARPQARMVRKALSIAAGVALGVGGWMFFQRSPSNEASGIIAQTVPNPQLLPESSEKPDVGKTEAGTAAPATDPPIQPSEGASTQTDTAKPSVQQIETAPPAASTLGTVANSSANPDRASKEHPRGEQVAADVPPANLRRRSDQSQRLLPSRREGETKPSRITASASAPARENKLAEDKPIETKAGEAKPAESKPVQVPQPLPTFNANKEANATPSVLNSNPPQPSASSPVDLAKEKPSVAPKQPEPILARTAIVTVSFDPYPSIRMPQTEKSKKSHQGKSLEMGRLLSRVDPVYPDEAKQQGVEGTVRVHAIFNREGTVQSVVQISGPPMLVPAAMNAVRQWHYSQTILGGQAMETEEDVTVQFRLANSTSKN